MLQETDCVSDLKHAHQDVGMGYGTTCFLHFAIPISPFMLHMALPRHYGGCKKIAN